MERIKKFYRLRKSIKQKATTMSLFVVILLFGFFLEAYMHNFNLVYIALFFVFAIAFSVAPFGLLNIGQLIVEFDHTDRLFAGDRGNCHFKISNTSHTPAWAIELHCASYSTSIQKIQAQSKSFATLEIELEKRGRLSIGKCELQSLFPISTVRFVLPLQSNCQAIVYPKPKGKSLQSFLAKKPSLFGEERDFDGLSPYSGSESISRIHWASVAKGEIAVKKFSHQMHSKELIFDFSSAAEDDEARLSQLTLWVLECERLNEAFRVKMPDRELRSKKEGVDAILEHFALY